MAHQRPSLFRSLLSPFANARGRDESSRSPHRVSGRRRCSSLERLEDRRLLTTTVFLDFGDGFQSNLLTTIGEIRRDLVGPDIRLGTFLNDDEIVSIVPMRTVISEQRFDFNDDGRSDSSDYVQLRSAIVDTVRRHFEPFDINVEVVSSRSATESIGAMRRNLGDPTGQFDAYVFVTGFNSRFGFDIGAVEGWLGIASAVDLIQNQQNVTDEVVFLDADFMIQAAGPSGWSYVTSIANVVSHEAGHSLGLRHINAGGPLIGQAAVDQDLISQSEIMTEGGGSGDDLLNVSFFNRFPLLMGDGNVNTTVLRNPFEILANDPDIGLRAGAPQYVTGTGGFDRISITRLDSQSASVSVQAFRDSTFTTPIPTNGSHSYVIDTTNGIVIEAGRGLDQITIDARLGVPVTIRGGQGFDQLIVNGVPGLDVSYTPDLAYRFIPGAENYGAPFLDDRREFVSYSGAVQAGNTAIRFTEFDDFGSITFNNFQSLLFNGSEGADNIIIRSPVAGTGEVEGTLSNVGFPNLRFHERQ